MHEIETSEYSSPEAAAGYVAQNAEPARQTQHDHSPTMDTVREATYRGHQIVIHTSYRIEVDGVPLQGHMALTNDGRVHYHAVPNVSFESAVDLVKLLIDTFPEDVPSQAEGETPGKEPQDGGSTHEHHH